MGRRIFQGLALLATVGLGCSHDLSGPEPEVSGAVSPHVVCNQQLDTPVDLQGSGFSPLPIETATGPALVDLPEVTLEPMSDLTGEPLSGEPVTVPDDPENPEHSDVTWHSQEHMSFVVREELGLVDGIHRIRVTNANDNEAVFDDAVAAVPPPTLDAVEPMAICIAEMDRVLEVIGGGFLSIAGVLPTVTFTSEDDGSSMTYPAEGVEDCTTLPAPAGDTESCNRLIVTVPQDDLPTGSFSVVVTNPPPAECQSTEPVTLDVVPPPELHAVSPNRICTGGGTIGLSGEGFRDGATVTAGDLEASTVDVAPGGESATASFGVGLDPGVYDVTIGNPEGCSDTLPDAMEVVQGPILFFIDPPVVFDGISTQISLYLSGAGSSVDDVRITPADGGEPIVLADAGVSVIDGRIQAVVPEGTPAGVYDVAVSSGGCDAVLPRGLTVTDSLELTVDDMEPRFGFDEEQTAVSIFGSGFVNTPRAYLNPESPDADTIATTLQSVSFVDGNRLTAVVPSGLPTGVYDLIVVNPTGEVGLLEGAFTVTDVPPPQIDHVLPASVTNDEPQPKEVTAEGRNLSGVTSAEWECELPDTTRVTFMGGVDNVTATTVDLTIDAGDLPRDTVCVLRLFDAQGAFGLYSAVTVTEPAANLARSVFATDMTTGRRALALVSGQVTSAASFLYAIGGDDGTPSTPHQTSESASVDLFGSLGDWFEQPNPLPQGTTFTDAWTIDRFIYLVGGSDGSGAVSDVWRAKILDPAEAPVITDISPQQGMGEGLDAGTWYYRVSAVMPEGHPENPGGETLASDPLVIQIPEGLPDTLVITLFWSAVPGAEEYRVYRSPAADLGPDSVELVATRTVTEFEDTGVDTVEGVQPLPFGAHGTWAEMPSLNTPREAAGVGHAMDLFGDGTTHYLYAVGGRDETGAALATYEYLPITVLADGEQAPDPAWIDGTTILQTDPLAGEPQPAPRAELGVYSANRFTAPRAFSGTEQYIYAVGGLDGMTSSVAEAAPVLAGGALGDFEHIVRLDPANAGFAYMTGNDALYLFGGGPSPSRDDARKALICRDGVACGGDEAPDVQAWSAQGWNLRDPRYQGAGTIQNAHLFIVGGTADGTTALSSTETTVW